MFKSLVSPNNVDSIVIDLPIEKLVSLIILGNVCPYDKQVSNSRVRVNFIGFIFSLNGLRFLYETQRATSAQAMATRTF